MRTILRYPNNKNLSYPSDLNDGSNFCNFLKEYDYSRFERKLQLLTARLEVKKEGLADVEKLKKELSDSTKFMISNWGQASLHLMIMVKHVSKLVLDLVPQAQLISKLQEIAYDAVEEIENDGFKAVETKDVIFDSLEDLADEYKPVVTIMEFINNYVTETIEKEDELQQFIKDMKNQFNNLDKEIKKYNTEVEKISKNQKALLKLKEEIENYISKNCQSPEIIDLKKT